MLKKIVITLIVSISLIACRPKKEKLAEAIFALETSDSSSTPKGMNQLAEMYFDYAKQFTKDSIAEKYLFKGFMFKYITGHWDDAIKYANFYKSSYIPTENYHSINLKLADLYNTGKNNPDSAVHYYRIADGKIQFSTDENRKAAQTLEKWVRSKPASKDNAVILFTAAKFDQLCGEFTEAVRLYAEVANNYPDFAQSPDALIAAGFICWNDLKELEKAKGYYKQLIAKYPNSPFAKEAKLILSENMLNMTELELADYMMKKNKEKGM